MSSNESAQAPSREEALGLTGSMLADLFEYPRGTTTVFLAAMADGDDHAAASAAAQHAGANGTLPPNGETDPQLRELFGVADAAERCAVLFALDHPEHKPEMVRFSEAIGAMTPDEREEIFARTFDFDPKRSLEMGWHLFGENYKRGKLLVRLRETLREHDLTESGKLPDHITLLLRLLDHLDQEDGEALIAEILEPALRLMKSTFENDDNPYGSAIRAVYGLLRDQIEVPIEFNTPLTHPTPFEGEPPVEAQGGNQHA